MNHGDVEEVRVRALKGTVEGDAVRVDEGSTLANGQKVLVVPLPASTEPVVPSPEAEEEDVAFVRACRGRLARQLSEEDADTSA